MSGELSKHLEIIQQQLKSSTEDIKAIVDVDERIRALTAFQEELQTEYDALVVQVKRLDEGFSEIVKQRDRAIEQSMNLIILNKRSDSTSGLAEQLDGVSKAYEDINRGNKGG